MEQHGKNPLKKVIAIIPARYDSVRLEGKLLLPIAGKPLILHTIARVSNSELVDEAVVATDDARIMDVVSGAGYDAVMTSAAHESGTDRVAEAAGDYLDADVIVNVQADEPMIEPSSIDLAVKALKSDPAVEMSTCCEDIVSADEVLDPNIVKVITDKDGFAIYFSRSPVPFPREQVRRHGSLDAALKNEPDLPGLFKKHAGLYVYRRAFLMRYANAERSELESVEMLEQLRALEMGARIRVVNVAGGSLGVDTLQDYEKVRAVMELG